MIFGNALSDAARRAAAKNEILSHKNANFGRRTEAKNEILTPEKRNFGLRFGLS